MKYIVNEPLNLSKRNQHPKTINGIGHVARFSKPSDPARERSRSSESRLFCKKTLQLQQNQSAVLHPLSGTFAKKPYLFIEINPQSSHQVLGKFAQTSLGFYDSTHHLIFLSGFFRKDPYILIKSNHKSFHSLLLHKQHYTQNSNTKTRRNKKLFNI